MPSVALVAELQGHARSVNCVRWSPVPGPGGTATLVSAGDGGEVFLWRSDGEVSTSAAAPAEADPFSSASRWRAVAVLRGHSDDVFDAAWAPDGSALATASLENLAILWDAPGGGAIGGGGGGGAGAGGGESTAPPRARARLDDHRHYVQGVAWDPAGVFLATQAADRTVRVYGPRPLPAGKRRGGGGAAAAAGGARPACGAGLRDLVCLATLARRPPREGELPAAPAAGAAAAEGAPVAAAAAPRAAATTFPLFADEQLPTFFRRLAWSPDGGLLAVPAGVLRPGGGGGGGSGSPPLHAAYLYARGRWAGPAVALPSARPVVAVRFCPVLFEKQADDAAAPPPSSPPAAAEGEGVEEAAAPPPSTWPFDSLPYRMVYALATLDGVALYDTASPRPLAFLGGLHPAPVTDLAWATDGRSLAVSSYDSYCSVVTFEAGELGVPLDEADVPPHLAARLAAAAKAGAPPTPPTPAPGRKASGAAATGEAAGRPSHPPPRPEAGGGSAVKRIQPTPVSAAAAAAAAGPTPRRIAPEPVAAAGGGAPPAPPSTGGPRRIAPVPIGGAGPAVIAAAAPSPRRIVPEPVGGGGVAEPTPRRLVPEPVGALAPADGGVTVTAPPPLLPPAAGGGLFGAGGIAAAAAKAGAGAAAAAAKAQQP